jgi:hypothetical protein
MIPVILSEAKKPCRLVLVVARFSGHPSASIPLTLTRQKKTATPDIQAWPFYFVGHAAGICGCISGLRLPGNHTP